MSGFLYAKLKCTATAERGKIIKYGKIKRYRGKVKRFKAKLKSAGAKCNCIALGYYLDAGKSVLIYNHRCRKPEKEYFDDIEKKLQDEVKVYWAVIQAITFPKGSIRDYFAIPACEEHAKSIKEAFVEMSESIWGQLGVCKLHPEWAKDIPLHYMTYDDHIFMEIESETFNKACSFEQYKRDIIRYLMHSSWHYSEKTAKAIVKNEMEYIQKSFKKMDTIADVAVEIGYGCG